MTHIPVLLLSLSPLVLRLNRYRCACVRVMSLCLLASVCLHKLGLQAGERDSMAYGAANIKDTKVAVQYQDVRNTERYLLLCLG